MEGGDIEEQAQEDWLHSIKMLRFVCFSLFTPLWDHRKMGNCWRPYFETSGRQTSMRGNV